MIFLKTHEVKILLKTFLIFFIIRGLEMKFINIITGKNGILFSSHLIFITKLARIPDKKNCDLVYSF